MNTKVKTSKIFDVYGVLKNAKYTKLDDDDKIKVWKIARTLNPIATKFDEDIKDASEKLIPCEDFKEKLQKAKLYEDSKRHGTSYDGMSESEYNNFVVLFKQYDNTVKKAVEEFAEKEVSIDVGKISEDAFGKLMSSNEWTMEQVMLVGDVICE